MKKWSLLILLAGFLLAGCAAGVNAEAQEQTSLDSTGITAQNEDTDLSSALASEDQTSVGIMSGQPGMGYGRGMGANNMAGMHARHHAQIPQGYAGSSNPLPYSEETLALGEELYAANCASCHGTEGYGDGPAGANLDPAPAVLAHSGMMMADDYLYWRISEGGSEQPFNSAMPAWGTTFSEEQIWQLVSYLRGLSEGWVGPQGGGRGPMMGDGYSDQIHAEMLAEAIKQGLISAEEAETFNTVHDALELAMVGKRGNGYGMGMEAIQDELLEDLVSAGTLTQEQADTFLRVHELLEEAGLMGCGGC